MRIEYHRTLIADYARNRAFYSALKAAIKPGVSVVADIGAGTGLLGVMAAKLGAKRVYMFEAGTVASVAADVIKANGASACQLLPCHSTEFDDALECDIIVSETLGNYALEENIIDTLNDARRRFLKPGGTIIPEAIEQWVAPVVSSRLHDELSAWDRVGQDLKLDLDLNVAKSMSFNNVYVRTLQPAELLEDGRSAERWDVVDLTRTAKSNRRGSARWVMDNATTFYGFAVWWCAKLSSAEQISTGPNAPTTHWEQLYFPLATPIAADKAESVEVALRSTSSEAEGTHLAWTAVHTDRHGELLATHRHDLDKGYLP